MENLGWGLQISVLGMGLVFALLALLWGLLTLVARWDRAPAADAAGASATGATPPAAAAGGTEAAASGDIDPALVAAITVAVLSHSAMRRHEAAPAMRAYWPGSLLHASRWVASGRLRQNRTFRKGR